MARESRRYHVATRGRQVFMLSQTSKDILQRVARSKDGIGYNQLGRLTGIPENSLYVFCRRLESARLIVRKKVLLAGESGLLRVRTVIRLCGQPLEFPATTVVH